MKHHTPSQTLYTIIIAYLDIDSQLIAKVRLRMALSVSQVTIFSYQVQARNQLPISVKN